MYHIFFAFIFFLIGLLSSIFSYYILSILLPLILFLNLYKKQNIKTIVFYISFTILAIVLIFIYPKGDNSATNLTGIIVEKSNSAYTLFTLKGKYYIYDKNDYNIFSIINVNGYVSKLTFSHYEGSFDYLSYLNSKGIFLKFNVTKTEEIFINRFSFDFLKRYSFQYLSADSKQLFSSLIFSSSITSSNLFILDELSLSSLLSSSGFHINVFLNFLLSFCKNSFKEKYAKYIKLIVLTFFLFFTSFAFSFRRLFLSCLLSILCNNKKKINYISKLSLVGFILLFFEPYRVTNSSFYFPFSLLFYLAIFPLNTNSFKGKFKNSLLILLFLLPFQITYKKTISLISLLSQLFIIPYSHFLFICSLLLLFIPIFGIVYNYLVSFLVFVLKGINNFNFYIPASNYLMIFIIIYYFLFILISILKTYNYTRFIKPALCLYLIPFSLTASNLYIKHDELVFIDVDQGDCTLLRYKNMNILFDTGGKTNVDLATKCLIPYFRSKNIKKLDYVFITHLDYDHYGALNSLQLNFKIDNVVYNTDFKSSNSYSYMIDELTIKNLNIYHVSDEENDNSAVYYFEVKNKKVLIQGDAPIEIENKIITDNPDLKADIIKIGHHGSKTSSSLNYLKKVNPELAIISVGSNNSYSLPSKETLVVLNTLHINYKRTDYEGSIYYAL